MFHRFDPFLSRIATLLFLLGTIGIFGSAHAESKTILTGLRAEQNLPEEIL